MDDKITYFAETDSRNKRVRFGIKAKDRTRHVYIIGKTGMGKSTALENMAVQDIQSGEGMAIIDPHGGTARKLLEYVPPHRVKDVVFFNPADLDNPISFNILEDVEPDKRHFVAAGLMNTFKKIWQDAWSARMEYILGNTLLALLEYPGATLLSVNKMLTDKLYRQAVVDNVKDPSVKSFWVDEFAKYTDKFAAEATPAIQNKIGQFTSNPLIRNLVGQAKSSFDFRQLMDEKKILIVNLSKGELGPDNMRLIGGMIVTKIYLGAMSRANVSAARLKDLPPFYFYVDEFQNFANESFAEILSEARKYKLALTVANQYIEQMTEEVRSAVIGNVGTMIVFRIGSTDADILEKEFSPEFMPEDMVNLGFAQIYLKLMIDGVTSRPFSATTLPPIAMQTVNYKNDVIEWSRRQYSKPRSIVEKAIGDWYNELAQNSGQKPIDRKTPGQGERSGPRPPERPYNDRERGNSRPDHRDDRRSAPAPARDTRYDRNESFPKKVVSAPVPTFEPEENEEKEEFVPLNKIKVEVKEETKPNKIEENLPKPNVPTQVVEPRPQVPNVVKPAIKIEQTAPRAVPVPPRVVNPVPTLVSYNGNAIRTDNPAKPNYGGKKASQQSLSELKSLLQNVIKKNPPVVEVPKVESSQPVNDKKALTEQVRESVEKNGIKQKEFEKEALESGLKAEEKPPINGHPADGKYWGGEQEKVDGIYLNGRPYHEIKAEYGHLLNPDKEYDNDPNPKPKEIPKDVLEKMLKVDGE